MKSIEVVLPSFLDVLKLAVGISEIEVGRCAWPQLNCAQVGIQRLLKPSSVVVDGSAIQV